MSAIKRHIEKLCDVFEWNLNDYDALDSIRDALQSDSPVAQRCAKDACRMFALSMDETWQDEHDQFSTLVEHYWDLLSEHLADSTMAPF